MSEVLASNRPVAATSPGARWAWLAALLLGGLMLVWPAVLNHYPLVFIDTFTYLQHTTAPVPPPWDKALVYGPLLHAFHWQWTLWLPMLAQGIAASWLLWLVQRALRGQATPGAHLLLCAGLAAGTAAPWVLATIMPDALSAQVPLCLFLLGFGRLSRREALAVGLCGTLAIGVHFAHLPLAAALVVLTGLLSRRLAPTLRVAAPLLLAVLLVGGANLASFGRFAIAPNGSIFLLGRLQEDGPATALLRERCGRDPAAAHWRLCGYLHWLPMDSDAFLWGISPLHSQPDGSLYENGHLLAIPDAREIVAATLAEYPGAVAAGMLRNTLLQLGRVQVGDTLPNDWYESLRAAIARGFPAAENARFLAGLQNQGLLPNAAAPFLWPHVPVVLLSLVVALLVLRQAARTRDRPRAALLLFVFMALACNAFITGALSRPHHRYQARLVWLLPAACALALMPRRAAPSAAAGPGRPIGAD